jgi:hypothetical protein
LDIDNLLHVDFLFDNVLLVCSRKSTTLDLWRCLKTKLIAQYELPEPILACATFKAAQGFMLRITLKSQATHYVRALAKFDEENFVLEVKFKPIAVLQQRQGTDSVFLNAETDVHFSKEHSDLFLYHFGRPEQDRLEKIGPVPSIDNRPFSRQFFFKKLYSALIWLSAKSVTI